MNKQSELAKKIWELVCEIDYDPNMSNFDNLDEPIKTNIMVISSQLIDGESSIYKHLKT